MYTILSDVIPIVRWIDPSDSAHVTSSAFDKHGFAQNIVGVGDCTNFNCGSSDMSELIRYYSTCAKCSGLCSNIRACVVGSSCSVRTITTPVASTP